ncbi:hypothetical protein Tco_0494868 [Tanacetum coccineum]
MKGIKKDEYKIESDVFNLLKINADLFTWDTPLATIFDEFSQLSSMDDDLFTYEVRVPEPSYFACVEQQYDNLKNGDLDFMNRECVMMKMKKIYAEAVILINKRFVRLIDITVEQWLDLKFGDHKRGDDEEVITYDELSDLEEENLSKENEIAKIFRIETNIFHFETPLCKAFKEFNYLLQIDNGKWVDMLNGLLVTREKRDIVMEEIYRKNIGGERKKKKNQVKMLRAIIYLMMSGSRTNEERVDEREPKGDNDDDIRDLDDYLIPKDAPYFVDEDEEIFKERRSKLLGIPYKKPPTFKSEKFEVIKYSFGLAKEYVAIKEYEYDIWDVDTAYPIPWIRRFNTAFPETWIWRIEVLYS